MAFEPRNVQVNITMRQSEYEWVLKLASRRKQKPSGCAYELFRRQLLAEARALTEVKEPPA